MTDAFRFIDAGEMDAPVSFGRFPMIAGGIVNGGPEVVMTTLFGRGHFQIGWFEDVDAVLDLDAARDAGVDVFRRPVFGGGAAFYDTNAVATFSWLLRPGAATLDEGLERFRPAMRAVLDQVGLQDVSFEGSSDIRWHGRKLGTMITQSVMGVTMVGGFLNLRKPDLELYAKVARVPPEKFKDKEIKDAVAYIATPSDVRGTDLPYEELRDAVVKHASVDLDPSAFTPDEEAGAASFAEAVGKDDWIRRISSERFRASAPAGTKTGFANVKGKKLVRAGVALDGNQKIAAAMMAGDMHVSPPDAMDRIATALNGGTTQDREDLLQRARTVFDAEDFDQPDAAAGITAEDCADAVVLAAKNAS